VGPRQHERPHSCAHGGLDQRERVDEVVGVEAGRFFHRITGFDECRKMQHRVHSAAREDALQGGGVFDAGLHEIRSGRDGGSMSRDERVQHGDRVPCCQQRFRRGGADVSGAAGYEDVHLRLTCFPESTGEGPTA
jgi:hypothetical protein